MLHDCYFRGQFFLLPVLFFPKKEYNFFKCFKMYGESANIISEITRVRIIIATAPMADEEGLLSLADVFVR